MKILNVKERIENKNGKENFGRKLKINAGNLIGVSTKSLYVRTGFLNGTLFLSQRGNGQGGSGDICKLITDDEIIVNPNLFERLYLYAEKAKAIIK